MKADGREAGIFSSQVSTISSAIRADNDFDYVRHTQRCIASRRCHRFDIHGAYALIQNRRRPMDTNNKQLVSLRLSRSDLTRIKRVAVRLGVRESEVMRFAIRAILARLAPLHDGQHVGHELLPVFVELGQELSSHFDLDSTRLEAIINDRAADPSQRVAPEDIKLLAMSTAPAHYQHARLRELTVAPFEAADTRDALGRYLYEKYTRRPARAAPRAEPEEVEAE
jgi:hypothetical protein